MPTEDGWLEKDEVAQMVGCTERTVERHARAGRLGARRRPGFPTVYDPAAVAKLVPGSQPTHQGTLLAPIQTPPSNGNGHHALAPTNPGQPVQVVLHVDEALAARLLAGPTGPTNTPTGPTPSPWMTVIDIMRAWGWPRANVQALIDAGKLGETFRLGQRQRQVVRRSEVKAFEAGRNSEAL